MNALKGNIFNLLCCYSSNERIRLIMEKRYGQALYVVYSWMNENGDPDLAYSGYDLIRAQEVLDECDRVEGYEHRECTWYLEEQYLNEVSILIDSKNIAPINESTDAILYEVQQYFGGKYTYHDTIGGSSFKLRIADHSGKYANMNGEHYLSVVIANQNATHHFRTEGGTGLRNELFFDESHKADAIIANILESINIC